MEENKKNQNIKDRWNSSTIFSDFYFPIVPIQLFSSKPYIKNRKRYYLRGHIGSIEDQVSRDIKLLYNLQMIVLISEKYKSKKIGTGERNFDRFGYFIERTEKKYLELKRKQFLKGIKRDINDKKTSEDDIKKQLDLWCPIGPELEVNEFKDKIIPSPYVQLNLKNPDCSMVLLKLDLEFDEVAIQPEDGENIRKYERQTYSLLARNFSDAIVDRRLSPVYRTLMEFFDDTISSQFYYTKDTIEDYKIMLFDVANFSYQWIEIMKSCEGKKENTEVESKGVVEIPILTLEPSFLKKLKDFQLRNRTLKLRERKKNKNGNEGKFESDPMHEKREQKEYEPVKEFCCQCFDALINNMKSHNFLKICKNCFKIITDKKRKFYCDNKCSISYFNRENNKKKNKEKKKKGKKNKKKIQKRRYRN